MAALCIMLSLVIMAAAATKDVSVKTNVGTFVGFSDKIDLLDGSDFDLVKFLGVPYAEPPVGDLRFRKPIAKAALTEPLDTKAFGSACMQLWTMPVPQVGSEDCLFLNIFGPASSLEAAEKIPVMIWIHGGGFSLGSANSYYPDRLVANGPVIVVTINYRLSIWGFLSTGTGTKSPGNYGFWDQHLAIQWVHDNIDNFGGDPNSITIFGESAGSLSVVFQGLYPGNKGLFKGMIGQSGSPIAVWGTSRDPLSEVKEFASYTGCTKDDDEEMVDCLRKLENSVINATLNDFSNGLAFRMVFLPYPDGEFLEVMPNDLVENTQTASPARDCFGSFDLLTGVNSGEGYLFTPPGPMQVEAWKHFMPNISTFREALVPQFLQYLTGVNCPALTEAVTAEYTDWDDPENPEIIREKYIDLAGDGFFLGPMVAAVDLHASLTARQSSYMYYFTATPSVHGLPTPTWATRPNHGDDIIYVFAGIGDLSEFGFTDLAELTDWEIKLATDVMTMWTNFAKTGNPNRPRDIGIDWLPYTKGHQHYMDISAGSLSPKNVKTRLEGRRANFWAKLVPAIISQCKKVAPNAEGTCEKDGGCDP